MRTYQHADDSSTHKQHANAANANDNAAKEKPYCNWCYKERGFLDTQSSLDVHDCRLHICACSCIMMMSWTHKMMVIAEYNYVI